MTSSYHDNFDDAYRDSPRWDESLIARDSQGGLQQGGVWAGGQSYIIAFQSEGLTAPFVGVIGHSWHLWRNNDPVFKGEESIPFIPMIYHGGPTTNCRT